MYIYTVVAVLLKGVDLATSKALSDQLTEKSNIHVHPSVQASLNTVIERINKQTKGMIEELHDRLAELINTVSTNQAGMQIIQDAAGAEVRNIVSKMHVVVQKLSVRIEGFVVKSDRRYYFFNTEFRVVFS